MQKRKADLSLLNNVDHTTQPASAKPISDENSENTDPLLQLRAQQKLKNASRGLAKLLNRIR